MISKILSILKQRKTKHFSTKILKYKKYTGAKVAPEEKNQRAINQA